MSAPTAVGTWLRLLACANLVEGRVRAGLRRRFGTTLPRFDLLAQLDHAEREGRDGLTMSELSRRLMVSNGNVTGLAERLTREGLVSRTTPRDDRRAQLLRLTSAGRRALAEMAPVHHAWIEALFAGLEPTERETLHALLGRLRTSVEGAMTEDDAVHDDAPAARVGA